jgi:hypothetical protein
LQEQSDPARIPALVAEQHRDLVETYNVFIIGDEKGRELDQIRIGPQERVAANDALNAAMPIIEAVEAAEGVATARAIETLRDHAHAELTATSGIDGDQAAEVSRRTNANFVVAMLRAAYIAVRKLGGEGGVAWKEIRAGVYRAAGPAAIGSGYVYHNEIVAFVSTHAESLKMFVEQTFHNPALVRIVDLISKVATLH